MKSSRNVSPDKVVRVSVSEASRLFGVSSKSIRLAIKNKDVRYIVVRGRYKLMFSSLVTWSQKNKRRINKLNQTGIGQYVENWKISVTKYSPRTPE